MAVNACFLNNGQACIAASRLFVPEQRATLSHDPLTHFGGFKQSGMGREGGIFGLKEFLEPKAIVTE